MADRDRFAETLDRARALLARREHSRQELVRKLQAHGDDAPMIALALDRLVEEGALDESRLIEQYVAERAGKGFGPLRIRAELIAKGLSDEQIDPYLSAMSNDWEDYLAEVYDRRFGGAPPPDQPEYGRRGRFLEQRGFPTEMIRRLMRAPE